MENAREAISCLFFGLDGVFINLIFISEVEFNDFFVDGDSVAGFVVVFEVESLLQIFG